MARHDQDAATRRLWWALVLALAAYSAGVWVQVFRIQGGVDFYHFWGIAAAHSSGEAGLGTPYANGPRYAALLNARADASQDPHFKRANQERRSIDPTGTPLFYATFAILPADYTTAHALFRALQLVCLCAAVALLGCMLGLEFAQALCLGCAASIVYQPFQSEMAVGNVNSLQLLACVAFVGLARRLKSRTGGRGLAGAVLLALLVAFALYKPNLALVSLFLALFVARELGLRAFAGAAAAAITIGAALVWLSATWFGAPGAWSEWYEFVSGPGGSKIAGYPVSDGNYAAVVLLAGEGRTATAYTLSIVLTAALGLAWVAAAWTGRAGLSLRNRLLELCSDPLLLVSTALLLALAAAPLVWFHYAVLGLLPCLWLAFGRERTDPESVLALLALGLYAALAPPFLELVGLGGERGRFTAWTVGFAWVPAWCALLLRLARPERVSSSA